MHSNQQKTPTQTDVWNAEFITLLQIVMLQKCI